MYIINSLPDRDELREIFHTTNSLLLEDLDSRAHFGRVISGGTKKARDLRNSVVSGFYLSEKF